jgi:hypothetical protein
MRRSSAGADLDFSVERRDDLFLVTGFRIAHAKPALGRPSAKQALGAGCAGAREKFAQVFGTIDIKRDAGKLQDFTGLAGGARGGEMRLEAVIAKTQRE